MEKPLDLRIQKTHMALMASFRSLLEQKKFEDITVNEICEKAMVRRATFYKHFGDKYEFFSFMVRMIAQESFCATEVEGAKEDGSLAPYALIVHKTVKCLDDNERMVRSVIQSDVFPILLDIVSEQILLEAKEHFANDAKTGRKTQLPPDFLAEVFTGFLISAVRWWLKHKRTVSKDELTQHVFTLMEKLNK